jgi:Xaa-Pro dipeptidase
VKMAAAGRNDAPSMARAEEVGAKLESIRNVMQSKGWAGVVLESQAGFAWATAGGRSHISIGEQIGVASVVVTADAAYVLTTNIEAERLMVEEIPGLPFSILEYPWHEDGAQSRKLRELCDPARAVTDVASGGPLLFAKELHELRYVLGEPEHERYRSLGRDAAAAVEKACLGAEPGDVEADVAARVAYECAALDILALVNLVAADERIAAYRHPLPTTKRLHSTLLVALTGRRYGLHASLTRMVSFGSPDDDLASRHRAVTQADATVVDSSKTGTSLAEAMAVLVDTYAGLGFPGEWQRHHQGGLTGYAGREIFATATASHRIRIGEALAWNPSITRVKSEDTILVGESGCEVLTTTGRWPQNAVEVSSGVIERPALLVR